MEKNINNMVYLTIAITIVLALSCVLSITNSIYKYRARQYKDCIEDMGVALFLAICTWLGFIATLYYELINKI